MDDTAGKSGPVAVGSWLRSSARGLPGRGGVVAVRGGLLFAARSAGRGGGGFWLGRKKVGFFFFFLLGGFLVGGGGASRWGRVFCPGARPPAWRFFTNNSF